MKRNMFKERLKEKRDELLKDIEKFLIEVKRNTLQQLHLEQIISDVKQGCDPDWGFLNELKFDDEKVGWNLFCGVISPYPKYQKLANYVKQYHEQQ